MSNINAIHTSLRALPTAATSLTDGVSGSTASWSLWITNKDKHRFIWCLLRYVRSHITQSCRYPCREIEDSMNQKAEKGLETWRIQVSSWSWNKQIYKKQKQACNWPKVKRITEEHIHKPSPHPKDLSKAFSFDTPFHPLIVRLCFSWFRSILSSTAEKSLLHPPVFFGGSFC